jgi:N-ethylmaleimide reductase
MSDSDPEALFDHVAQESNQFGVAYVHIIEPRVGRNVVIAEGRYAIAAARLRKILNGQSSQPGALNPELPRRSSRTAMPT